MLRAIWVIGLLLSHFFSLWLLPVFPGTAIKTHLLAKYLPCWTFEISYIIDLHTWVIVILQNMSVVYRRAGTGIENARVDSEQDTVPADIQHIRSWNSACHILCLLRNKVSMGSVHILRPGSRARPQATVINTHQGVVSTSCPSGGACCHQTVHSFLRTRTL